MRRSVAIFVNDLRIVRRDPAFVVVMILMPLLVIAFVKPAFQDGMADLVPGATGAEQAVPGMAVMFAMFLMGNVGYAVYREHGWHTWNRLRVTVASPAELMLGKAVVPFILLVVQLIVLFTASTVLFDLRMAGAVAGVTMVGLSFACCLVAMGFLIAVLCRSLMQLNAITNLGAMVLAGVGGALVPLEVLPTWARHLAPLAPSYWAMQGFRSQLLYEYSFAAAVRPSVVLLCFSGGFAAIAALRYQVDDTKSMTP